ncbi:MAG: hypothetical protein ACR2JU_06245 [Nocardioidaceae bacterium]
MLEPYAIVTARNLVASMWREQDRHRRNQHRIVDVRAPAAPEEELLRREERDAVTGALNRLPTGSAKHSSPTRSRVRTRDRWAPNSA